MYHFFIHPAQLQDDNLSTSTNLYPKVTIGKYYRNNCTKFLFSFFCSDVNRCIRPTYRSCRQLLVWYSKIGADINLYPRESRMV